MIVIGCAVGAVTGIAGLVWALRSTSMADGAHGVATGGGVRLVRRQTERQDNRIPGIALAVISALIVGTVTRWPVAALLAAVAAFLLPGALKSTSSRNLTRRTEAVAVWTELLRDTLSASAGLAQSIVATASVAPDEIRWCVTTLADRIMSGVPMDDALRMFAIDVDDPSAEEVVCALRLAASSRAQRLVDLLGALADSTRDEVSMRLRVEASRTAARSGVRTVVCFSLGFVALLTIVARSYLAPFGSIAGQLVLVLVGALYAAGLVLMVRLVRPPSSPRPARDGQLL
jgi:Flp pilus assembly protein TadB